MLYMFVFFAFEGKKSTFGEEKKTSTHLGVKIPHCDTPH